MGTESMEADETGRVQKGCRCVGGQGIGKAARARSWDTMKVGLCILPCSFYLRTAFRGRHLRPVLVVQKALRRRAPPAGTASFL